MYHSINEAGVPSPGSGNWYPKSQRSTSRYAEVAGFHTWVVTVFSRQGVKNTGEVACGQVVTVGPQYWSHGVSGQFSGCPSHGAVRQRTATPKVACIGADDAPTPSDPARVP